MAKLIDGLLQDHINMQKLLAALERQINVFDAGGAPDYEIIDAVMQYCLTYPDTCHHPREDAIYRQMARKPHWDGAIHDLLIEHETLSAQTKRVAETLRSVVDDIEFPRDTVIQLVREFLNSYRHHITMENEFFFPNAEKMLDEEDWAAIDAELQQVKDPLFGPESDARFAALAQETLDWDRD